MRSTKGSSLQISAVLELRSCYFADHHASAVQQDAEFIHAKATGLIDDSHLLGEIGAVFIDSLTERREFSDITIYKSLGNVVQDIASGWWLY